MLELTFRIRHERDWSATINDTFPDLTSTILHSYRPNDRTIMMVEATAVRDIDAVVAWFRDHPAITDARVSSYDAARTQAYLVLEVDYGRLPDFESVMDVVTRNSCCPTLPVTNEHGLELWRILAPDHDAVKRTYTELQRIGTVEVESLTAPEVGHLLTTVTKAKTAIDDLSPRQREISQRAIEEGYYDVPRGCTLEQLADADETTTSTVAEHLRRAEAKLFEALAPLISDEPQQNAMDATR